MKPEPGQQHELFSVPTFPTGLPEVLDGAEIGSSKRVVEPGDVLVCKINPRINRVWVVPEPLGVGPQIASSEYLVFRPGNDAQSRFLMWYLRSPAFRDWITMSVEGATGSHTRAKSGPILKQRVPIPPLAEQERIVAAIEEQFSRLDAAEASLVRAGKSLSRMEAAFLTALGAGTWPVRLLREFLTEPLRNGHSAKAAPDGQAGVRTLTLTAVTARDFSDANAKITVASPSKVKDLWLKPGDILIERSNTAELVGSAAIFDGEAEWAIFPDLMIRARVGGDLLPRFLDLVLRTPEVRRYFREKAQGISSSMPKISQSTIETLPVPVPPLTIQEEVVSDEERLSSIMSSLRKSLNTTRQRAAGLRSVVLRDAFAGRLILQDSADSPESIAPEKVRA